MPRITLAAPYTDGDGKQHKADSTIDVDAGVASALKFSGLARDPESTPNQKAADKSATTKKEA